MCDCRNAKTYKKVTHCIFDLDGTLIDTEKYYQMVIAEMLQNFGKELTFELYIKTLGLSTYDLWKFLIEKFDLEINLEETMAAYRAKCREVLVDYPLLPGAELLVRHLHKHNIPMAIATSSESNNVELKTRHVKGLISLFSHVTSAVDNPDVNKGKPSPDVYLCCVAQFSDRPKPERCLAFEDSLSGLTSALRAGLQCIMINNLLPREGMCECGALKKVTHCIFDLDGTLLDTENVYKRIIGEVLADYGKEYTTEARAKMFGRTTRDTWKTAIEIFDLQVSLEDVVAEFQGRCKTALFNCPLMSGVEKLVRHLHENNVPIAVATSSNGDKYLEKTQHLEEFFSLFHHAVTAGTDPEVERGKPNPDIFLICASRFPDKPRPRRCLVFEDSPSGVESAYSAGMQCIWIPDRDIPVQLGEKATLVLNTMGEFKPEMFGLPPFSVH